MTAIKESSGNVFADLKLSDADELLAKAELIQAARTPIKKRFVDIVLKATPKRRRAQGKVRVVAA